MSVPVVLRRFDAASDIAAMADRIAGVPALAPAAEWFRLEIPRVLPFRDGFVVQYTAPSPSGGKTVLWGELGVTGGKPFADDRSVRFDDLDLSIPVFPHDPDLQRLERILVPAAAGPLNDVLDAGADRAPAVTLLAYRLRRRCVVRWETSDGDAAAVKMVRRRKLSDMTARHVLGLETAAASDNLRVPRLLGVDEDLGACAMEWMPGATLHALADDPVAVDAHRHAGASLRDLHRGHAVGSAILDRDRELAGLDVWAGVLDPVRPEVAEALRMRRDRLAVVAGSAAEAPVLTHADYYDKQVLVDGDTTSLIDLDGLAAAEPARDLGNALAHLELRRLQGRLSDEAPARCGLALLDGYGDVPSSSALSWWKAASLTRLAALYAIRPRWRHLAQPLIEEVDACLAP